MTMLMKMKKQLLKVQMTEKNMGHYHRLSNVHLKHLVVVVIRKLKNPSQFHVCINHQVEIFIDVKDLYYHIFNLNTRVKQLIQFVIIKKIFHLQQKVNQNNVHYQHDKINLKVLNLVLLNYVEN
jgi:hypothetical protein